jgi:hypothetical protein
MADFIFIQHLGVVSLITDRCPPASKLGALQIGPKTQSGDLLKNDIISFD